MAVSIGVWWVPNPAVANLDINRCLLQKPCMSQCPTAPEASNLQSSKVVVVNYSARYVLFVRLNKDEKREREHLFCFFTPKVPQWTGPELEARNSIPVSHESGWKQ